MDSANVILLFLVQKKRKIRVQSPQEAQKNCKILQAAVPKMSQTFSITTPILNHKVSDKFLWHYQFDGILFPGTASHN